MNPRERLPLDPNRVKGWLTQVLPHRVAWTGDDGITRCPWRQDRSPSFSVSAALGSWHDFSTGESGGLCDLAERLNAAPPWSDLRGDSEEVRERLRMAREAEALERAAATVRLRDRYEKASPCEGHLYLTKKGVASAEGLRIEGDRLIVPLYDRHGGLCGLQLIAPDGAKRLARGSVLTGSLFPIGPRWETARRVILAEGLATGLSLSALIPGAAVLVSFSAVNIPEVARIVREVNPGAELFCASDNDPAGRKAAREAAKHKALPLVPEGPEGFDWNDVYLKEGEDMAREVLVRAIDEARKAPAPVLLDHEDNELELPGDGVPFPDDEQNFLEGEFDGLDDKSDNNTDNGPDRDPRDDSWRKSHEAHGPEKKNELRRRPALRLNAISARDLARMELPEIRWAVPDFVPEGLTILGGPPKLGKSVLALHLGLAVASGGVAFSSVPVERGAVLYLALEDTNRRLQGRIRAACPDGDVPADLDIVREAPRVGEGLEEALGEWVAAHPSARLIVVDTWQKVRPPKKSGSDPYEADYRTIGALKKIADDAGIAVILIHHTRKGPSNPVGAEGDFLESLLGSQAIAGAADGVMVLRRARGERSMTLSLTGRDIEERSVALTADFEGMTYRLEGDAVEARATEIQRQIIRVLRDRGEDVSVGDIAAETGAKRDNVRTTCWKMERSGLIRKGTKSGHYRYGEPPLHSPSSVSCLSEEREERKERRNARNGGTEAPSSVIPVPVPPLRSSAFPGVPEGGTAPKPCAARVHENSVPPFLPFLESDGTRGTGAESPEGVPPERSEERERNGTGGAVAQQTDERLKGILRDAPREVGEWYLRAPLPQREAFDRTWDSLAGAPIYERWPAAWRAGKGAPETKEDSPSTRGAEDSPDEEELARWADFLKGGAA